MSDTSATLMVMQATNLTQAQVIYTQLTETVVSQQQSEDWVIMQENQTKVFTIDTTSQQINKPVAVVPVSEINTTTKVPIGYTGKQAWRIKKLFDALMA